MSAVNPIIYADSPDPDVVRVGEVYYMSSTTMHMFPVRRFSAPST